MILLSLAAGALMLKGWSFLKIKELEYLAEHQLIPNCLLTRSPITLHFDFQTSLLATILRAHGYQVDFTARPRLVVDPTLFSDLTALFPNWLWRVLRPTGRPGVGHQVAVSDPLRLGFVKKKDFLILTERLLKKAIELAESDYLEARNPSRPSFHVESPAQPSGPHQAPS
jgi:hypothetical protein